MYDDGFVDAVNAVVAGFVDVVTAATDTLTAVLVPNKLELELEACNDDAVATALLPLAAVAIAVNGVVGVHT